MPPIHLERLRPDSADPSIGAVITVEIVGTGFTPERNRVRFGSLDAGSVPSVDGRTMTFVVPSSYPARGEAPPPHVGPGRYAVSVSNANGTSDSLIFTLTGRGQ
ncbi:MAG TPA: IPT/TIG domain-containing protein [Gemmatimonadaceae bacterium]|nr:IPT/TIG domain-containing protein [Gemmatimonadaceae bacterium]